MASVAVGLQIWELTNSSLMVGLVGLAQLIPLVGFGLYGGSLSDTFDRRTVGLITAFGMWASSLLLLTQAFLNFESVGFLYLVVAIQSAFFSVGNPARHAIIPRIVPADLLPAANALGIITWNLGFTLGPLIGGFLVATTGAITAPYLLDVFAFMAVIYAMYRLPKLPPTQEAGTSRGWKSVKEGFVFMRGKINLQMTFYQDIAAMVFGMPRALFPAIAALWFGGSTQEIAFTLGLLTAAPALGGLISGVFSGPWGGVRWQGRGIVGAIILWGTADNVSAIFRMTILQAATPDRFRGRLQGVHTVVVAGGPRLGDVEAGVVASLGGEAFSVISGGLLCVGVSLGLAAKFRSFLRYDAKDPIP